MKLSLTVATILSPAYGPCPEFETTCTEMRWNPAAGHVPRGFLGACGDLSEVELVLVVAEPGDPHEGESHTGLDSAYNYAAFGFRSGKDLFHRNIRKILDMCWPNLPFELQMRRVWLTESVLCSAQKECGPVRKSTSLACGRRYLLPQLETFPDALVVALGNKANDRLIALGVRDFIKVGSVAPPGCNQLKSRESWKGISLELTRRRSAIP
jgi:hypothetical protein